MNDVVQVADNVAALYLGRMAAQVAAEDVDRGQIVELITAGRSGDLGLSAEGGTGMTATTQPRLRSSRPRGRRRRRSRCCATTSAKVRGGDVGALPAILGFVVARRSSSRR